MKPVLVAPSILSANFGNLEKDFAFLNKSEADWIHVDIMDGKFVPNISFGFPVLSAIRKLTSKPLDVHLMISQPAKYIGEFRDAGADHLTIHYEQGDKIPRGMKYLQSTLAEIKSKGMKAGIAFNPDTPVSNLEEILGELDIVCLMSVFPGYGGQKFIPTSLEKIIALAKLIQERKSKALIEVDGGVTLENARSIVDAGADVLVAGNTVFSSKNPAQTIEQLKHITGHTIAAR